MSVENLTTRKLNFPRRPVVSSWLAAAFYRHCNITADYFAFPKYRQSHQTVNMHESNSVRTHIFSFLGRVVVGSEGKFISTTNFPSCADAIFRTVASCGWWHSFSNSCWDERRCKCPIGIILKPSNKRPFFLKVSCIHRKLQKSCGSGADNILRIVARFPLVVLYQRHRGAKVDQATAPG